MRDVGLFLEEVLKNVLVLKYAAEIRTFTLVVKRPLFRTRKERIIIQAYALYL